MKIIDCFTFFNELDLLELRLKLLDKHVDHFVIAESNLTYSGIPKPYYFKESEDRFKPWLHKIIHLPVVQDKQELVFETQTSYNPVSAEWKLENGLRNALLDGVINMDESDLVLVSDLDEMYDPKALKKAMAASTPVSFSLLFHYYFLNCQNTGESRWWNGSIASTVKQFREITPQGLRNNRDVYPSLSHAGWHFSFMGGLDKIKHKILSFAHTEYKTDEFTNEKYIRDAVLKGDDIFKRKGVVFNYMPLSYYPAELQNLMKQYPALLNLPKKNPVKDWYYMARRIIKGGW